MAHKLVPVDEKDIPAGMGRGHNTPPPEFRRDKDAALQAISYGFTHTDYRQFPHEGRTLSVTLYWDDRGKQGWGVATEGGGIQLYAFGCAHKNTTSVQLRRCLRKVTCKDCGYTTEIDSSD